MTNIQETKQKRTKFKLTSAVKDLIVLACVTIFVFVLTYFFNVFIFLVEFFKKHPQAITWIDEIITGLLTLSIGFAVFSWRRWLETQKEFTERVRLQDEIIKICEIKAETERIICKQLHCDIAEYKKVEKDNLSRQPKAKNDSNKNNS